MTHDAVTTKARALYDALEAALAELPDDTFETQEAYGQLTTAFDAIDDILDAIGEHEANHDEEEN